MKRIIEVEVSGDFLNKDSDQAGTQHEANATTLRITFDESWDSYAKSVTFWDARGLNPVTRVLTVNLLEDITKDTRVYLCPIPGEPLAVAGRFQFVIEGYVGGQRQRAVGDVLKARPAPRVADNVPATDPTPTQAQQLQGQIDAVIGNIQRAIDAANAADSAIATAQAAQTAAGAAVAAAAEATQAAENAKNAVVSKHASKHAAGGEDAITPSMIGAVPTLNQVPDGCDLNTVTESGFYRLNVTHGNMPAECGYGQLLVIHGGNDTIVQICVAFNNTMYSRSGNPPDVGGAGGWTGWRQIAYSDTVVKKAGDTMTGRLKAAALEVTDYGTPFEAPEHIDFHSAGSVLDYNGRLSIMTNGDLNYVRANGTGGRIIFEGLITKSTVDIGEGAAMQPGSFYIVYQ